MWKVALCILSSLCYAYGSFENDMAKTIQMCCSTGTEYAMTHKLEECSHPAPVPSGVTASFGPVCSLARTQCCEAYFMKEACNNGIDLASSTDTCDPVQGTGKMCCDNCKRGQAAGQNGDMEACTLKSEGNSPEELLAADAYKQCCEKSAKESHTERTSLWGHPDHSTRKPESVLPSVCEDYAPTELCAHHCIPVPGSYKCECNPGFMLMADGRNCMEVVKNRCKPKNPCHHKCYDNGFGVKCSCRRGFELMADRKSCKDIDECALDMQICLPGTQCVNVRGSYKCIPVKKNSVEKGQCPPGFARNLANSACDDINECELPHPPCPTYLCENTIGAYKCDGVSGDPRNLAPSNAPHLPADERCPPGFQLGVDNECRDMDECADQRDDCNHLSQFCINTHSSFYCQDKGSKHCPPGFKINPESNKCEDIDECEDNGEICRADQVCINQLGQYDCKLKVDINSQRANQKCPDGMRVKHGKLYCEDIDECVEGTHLCDQYQNCLNTNGSYECHCKLGYELDAVTGACVDMNECASGHHDCNLESQRCDNTVGSYLCIRMTSCGTGYILHHSTGKCEDSDECALGTHNCARAGPEYQCVNIPGSFRCVRKRTTTTSTTLAPEYEYEYYDSEEETADGNQTVTDVKPTEPAELTTTTTLKPETTSEIPQTTSSTTEEPPRRPDEENNIVPLDENQPTLPEITFKQPEEPVRFVPPLEPGDSKPTPYEPEQQPEIKPTEQSETQYEPVQPEEPRYTPLTEEPPRPSSSEPNPPDANESIEPQPETTISPTPEQTESTNQDPPQVVLVNVGQDTAKIDGERGNDGSVIVDTQDVPKNKWTKINRKPFSSVNCPPGFEIDEHGGCFDIDECATNRHRCSSLSELCRNTIGGYLCICAPEYRRDLYTGACDLIITSSSTTTSSTTPSTTTSTTTSTTPSTTTSTTSTTTPAPIPSTTDQSSYYGYPVYRITTRPFHSRNLCDFGFRLNIDTGECEDIDECTDGQTNCAKVEICVNTPGGYRCDCPPNWSLDEEQQRCLPIRGDEQFPPGYGNTPVQGNQRDIFRDTKTSFNTPEFRPVDDRGSGLRCGDGYYLTEYNTCEDIDECVNGQARCGQLQVCTNLPGGYVCGCPPGHRQVGDHECEDIDECALAGDKSLCSQNADCVNTIGSYQCQCHLGFRPAPVNDKVCVDVDECMESRAGSLCQQRCNNVWGGYRCSCHRGYRLNFDNSTCFDIDECEEFKSKIPCVGRCLNEPGSYRCSCPSGYRLSEDKRSCIDIDECENGEAPCAGGAGGGASDVCFNTRGGYRCNRITCPPGYHLEGKHRCSRIERNCRVGDWDCAHQPSTISFNYITFVSNLYIPDSKVKLFTMRGPTWQNAKMKFELRVIDVNAPPSVKNKAGVHYFNLTQVNNEAVVSLVHPLEGPQSIELQLIMELFYAEQFGGIAVAKLFIFVSEYEF